MKNLINKNFLNLPAIFIALLVAGMFISPGIAQTESELGCAMYGRSTATAIQAGGMWQTAHDTLNVVVVFVQFPDDMYDTTYSGWPTKPLKGEYPGPTYLKTFIDSTRFQMSTNGNLTHYFRQMSMGSFTLIGKARFIVTPHTRQWYINNGWRRWQINMEVLQTLDANFDFAPFDKYKFYSTYDIRKESDGRVDDIFMIYRNVAHDLPDSFSVMNGLGFSPAANGYAESSLGYATGSTPISFTVDGGLRRIYHAHPAVFGIADTLGLGTTSVLAGSVDSWTGNPPYRPQIHEFAHHWMTDGSNYGHNGAGFWGMLDAWGSRKNYLYHPLPNSWERELLGWIAPDSIYQTTDNVTLSDYVIHGRAIKIKVPGTNPNEFFRLEYHWKSSLFDNPEVHAPNAKGLYIIHQTGNTDPQSQLRLIPADGKWIWISDEYVYRPYTPQAIPVLKRSGVDRVNGIDDSRAVSYTWTGGSHPTLANPYMIHVYRDRVTN
ncbi:MAG: hypothetical protein Q8N03_11450 [Ignavibacteria bacterium]|nr:hypothetical protein [Ignavibacteria bacterium]